MANTPKPVVVSVNDKLPPVGESVIVLCQDGQYDKAKQCADDEVVRRWV
jgi:hypothetical protein